MFKNDPECVRQNAWHTLFGNLVSLEEKVNFVNRVWIDPDYKLAAVRHNGIVEVYADKVLDQEFIAA